MRNTTSATFVPKLPPSSWEIRSGTARRCSPARATKSSNTHPQKERSGLGGAGGGLRSIYQSLKLRIVTQQQEIGVLPNPFKIAIAALYGFFQSFKRFVFLVQNAVGARGVVKNVGIVRAQSNGHLKMALGLLDFARAGEFGSHQDTCAHILGNLLQLFP